MQKSIHWQMIDAGQKCFSHATDLYVYVNDVTTEIVNNYSLKENVSKFKSALVEDGGALMYDIPFEFDRSLE